MDNREVLSKIVPDRLFSLLEGAIDRYSPSYAEEIVVDYFEDAICRNGMACSRIPVPAVARDEGRANLVANLGPRTLGLLWLGHLDTIPLLPDEALGARRDGTTLYGLGSADMKGGCAAIVEAMAAVREAAIPLKRGVCAALVVGEEEFGDGALVLPDTLQAPITIVGEPTGNLPCLSHYGYLEIHLHAEGSRAHAALPDVGASAISAMLSWLKALVDAFSTESESGNLVLNIRNIDGGESRFVVADRCSAVADIHLTPPLQRAPIRETIEAVFQKKQLDYPQVALSWHEDFSAEGYSIDQNDQAVSPLKRAYSYLDMPFHPSVFRSHSDASIRRAKGDLPIVCGPGRLEVAHTPLEHVSLDEVLNAAKIYAMTIVETCAE